MFQKMYKDEPDNWQEVTEDEVKEKLVGYYHSVGLAIELMKEGIPQDTPFAIYKWVG